jgi:hypothetical protein
MAIAGLTGAAGGALGAAGGAIGSKIGDLVGNAMSLSASATAIVAGAAGGAIGGFMSSVAGSLLESINSGKDLDWGSVAKDALISAAVGAAAGGASAGLKQIKAYVPASHQVAFGVATRVAVGAGSTLMSRGLQSLAYGDKGRDNATLFYGGLLLNAAAAAATGYGDELSERKQMLSEAAQRSEGEAGALHAHPGSMSPNHRGGLDSVSNDVQLAHPDGLSLNVDLSGFDELGARIGELGLPPSVSATAAGDQDSPAAPGRTYRVRKDDQLLRLARRFNVSPGALAYHNRDVLGKNALLRKGTELRIPGINDVTDQQSAQGLKWMLANSNYRLEKARAARDAVVAEREAKVREFTDYVAQLNGQQDPARAISIVPEQQRAIPASTQPEESKEISRHHVVGFVAGALVGAPSAVAEHVADKAELLGMDGLAKASRSWAQDYGASVTPRDGNADYRDAFGAGRNIVHGMGREQTRLKMLQFGAGAAVGAGVWAINTQSDWQAQVAESVGLDSVGASLSHYGNSVDQTYHTWTSDNPTLRDGFRVGTTLPEIGLGAALEEGLVVGDALRGAGAAAMYALTGNDERLNVSNLSAYGRELQNLGPGARMDERVGSELKGRVFDLAMVAATGGWSKFALSARGVALAKGSVMAGRAIKGVDIALNLAADAVPVMQNMRRIDVYQNLQASEGVVNLGANLLGGMVFGKALDLGANVSAKLKIGGGSHPSTSFEVGAVPRTDSKAVDGLRAYALDPSPTFGAVPQRYSDTQDRQLTAAATARTAAATTGNGSPASTVLLNSAMPNDSRGMTNGAELEDTFSDINLGDGGPPLGENETLALGGKPVDLSGEIFSPSRHWLLDTPVGNWRNYDGVKRHFESMGTKVLDSKEAAFELWNARAAGQAGWENGQRVLKFSPENSSIFAALHEARHENQINRLSGELGAERVRDLIESNPDVRAAVERGSYEYQLQTMAQFDGLTVRNSADSAMEPWRQTHMRTLEQIEGYSATTEEGIYRRLSEQGLLGPLTRAEPLLRKRMFGDPGMRSEAAGLDRIASNNHEGRYKSLDQTINERGQLARERELAQAANWRRADGSVWHPPFNGAMPGTQRTVTLPEGTGVDRFGGEGGTYVSPAYASTASRALGSEPTAPGSAYSVTDSIPGVERSVAAPWFGQRGLGTQYVLPKPVQGYLDNGQMAARSPEMRGLDRIAAANRAPDWAARERRARIAEIVGRRTSAGQTAGAGLAAHSVAAATTSTGAPEMQALARIAQANRAAVPAEQGARRLRISAMAERAAQSHLDHLERTNQGAHFVERHGAQTSLESQRLRATTGANPSTGVVDYYPNSEKPRLPSSATRFFSPRDQVAAIQRARKIWMTTGDVEKASRPVKFPYPVGEGFKSKHEYYGRQYSAQVWFARDGSGRIATAYPLWGQ